MLMLLVWGPRFENHCSNLRDSSSEAHSQPDDLCLQTDPWALITLPPLFSNIQPLGPGQKYTSFSFLVLHSSGVSLCILLPTLICPLSLLHTLPDGLGEPLFSLHAQSTCLIFWLPSLNDSRNGINSSIQLFSSFSCGFLTVGSGRRQSWSESWLCLSQSVWSWESHLISSRLSLSSVKSLCENKIEDICKRV